MKTIRTKVYQFKELSNEAKEKAIDKLYDINVTDNWWEYTYKDASNIGLKITSFDIDKGYCKGEFTADSAIVANNILTNHGSSCETYKSAKIFVEAIKMIKNTTPVVFEQGTEDEYEDHSELNQLIEDQTEDFLNSLLEDYKIILRNEYEYQTSKEAIIETIEANEYDFTKDGKLFHS